MSQIAPNEGPKSQLFMFVTPFRLLSQGGVLFFICFLTTTSVIWFLSQETFALFGPILAAAIREMRDSNELVTWGLLALRGLIWIALFPIIIAVSALSIRVMFLSGRWSIGAFVSQLPNSISSSYGSLWRIVQIWQVYLVPILAVLLLKIIVAKYALEGQMPHANTVISTSVVAWVIFRLLPYFLLPFVMTIGAFDIEYAKSFAFHLIQRYRGYFVMILSLGAAIVFCATLLCDISANLKGFRGPILYATAIYLTYVWGCATVVKIAEVEMAQRQAQQSR